MIVNMIHTPSVAWLAKSKDHEIEGKDKDGTFVRELLMSTYIGEIEGILRWGQKESEIEVIREGWRYCQGKLAELERIDDFSSWCNKGADVNDTVGTLVPDLKGIVAVAIHRWNFALRLTVLILVWVVNNTIKAYPCYKR